LCPAADKLAIFLFLTAGEIPVECYMAGDLEGEKLCV